MPTPFCRTLVVFALGIAVHARPVLAQPYDRAPSQLRVMTWNVEWMFDDYLGDNRSELSREQSAPSAEFWQVKLDGVAKEIANYAPEIVALQEIEGQQTLAELAERLRTEYKISYRYAFIQGSDTFTEQDVGVLVRGGLVSFRRHEQSKAMFDSRVYYNLSKHLVCEFKWSDVDSPLTLMVLHLRATEEAQELRTKQAKLARHWLEAHIAAGEDVIILGDLNSEVAAGNLADDIAAIVGEDEENKMLDLLTKLPDSKQSTHAVLDKQFDRMLASPSLMSDGPESDWSFEKIEVLTTASIRGEPDGDAHWKKRLEIPIAELDLSDHYPVMATFRRQ